MVQNVGELKSGFQKKILKQFFYLYIGVMEKKENCLSRITGLCIWMQNVVIVLNALN